VGRPAAGPWDHDDPIIPGDRVIGKSGDRIG
jgi:hypothetical protein